MTDQEPFSTRESKGMLSSRPITLLVVAIVACVVLVNVWSAYRAENRIQSSPNWAGYVWPNARPVQFVSANVTVPTLDCYSTANARSSAWVGVGGYGANSIWPFPQTGINMDCLHGKQVDFTWCSHSSFRQDYVEPGDLIAESVYRKGGQWFCEVQDVTAGSDQVHGLNYSYKGTLATSEWIVEDPTLNLKRKNLAKLANFRSVSFQDLKTGPGKVVLGTGNLQHEIQIEGSSGKVEAKPTWTGPELQVTFR